MKFDRAGLTLIAVGRELALPRRDRGEHAARAGEQKWRGPKSQHGRDVRVPKQRLAVGLSHQLRDLHEREAVVPLPAEEDPEIRRCPLQFLRRSAGVQVRHFVHGARESGVLEPLGHEVRGCLRLIREPCKNLQLGQLGTERGLERSGLGQRIVAAFAARRPASVGPDCREALQPKLARGDSALIDGELHHPPVVLEQGPHAFLQQGLVVAILLLEVMLTDEQSLGPNRLFRHVVPGLVSAARQARSLDPLPRARIGK
jgi:hypothetical protein